MSIKEVIKLAAEVAARESGETITAYILERIDESPGENETNRIAGAPIGVKDEKWPRFEDQKMAHAITMDVSNKTELCSHLSDDTKAIALFVSSLTFNGAFEPGTPESAVLELSESDLANGVNRSGPDPEEDDVPPAAATFTSTKIEIPVEVFDEELYERPETDPAVSLHGQLYAKAIAGGKPFWIQGPEHEGQIVLQFGEELVDMNLGDAGCMYVFRDTAFWQCN